MQFAIDYETGAGTSALYLRQRNFAGQYANFDTFAWDDVESLACRAYFSEPNPVNAPGFFAVTVVPISGSGWPLEIVEAETGLLLFKGETDAVSVAQGEYRLQVTTAAQNWAVPDVTVSLYNADGTILLDQRTTDAMGVAVFPVTTGSYTFTSRLSRYSFPNASAQIIGQDVAIFVNGAALVTPVRPEPDYQRLMISAKRLGIQWAKGDKVTITPLPGQKIGNTIISTQHKSMTINADGYAEYDNELGILLDIGVKVRIQLSVYYDKTITIDAAPEKYLTEYL